jgi:hypothetical protein
VSRPGQAARGTRCLNGDPKGLPLDAEVDASADRALFWKNAACVLPPKIRKFVSNSMRRLPVLEHRQTPGHNRPQEGQIMVKRNHTRTRTRLSQPFREGNLAHKSHTVQQ